MLMSLQIVSRSREEKISLKLSLSPYFTLVGPERGSESRICLTWIIGEIERKKTDLRKFYFKIVFVYTCKIEFCFRIGKMSHGYLTLNHLVNFDKKKKIYFNSILNTWVGKYVCVQN